MLLDMTQFHLMVQLQSAGGRSALLREGNVLVMIF